VVALLNKNGDGPIKKDVRFLMGVSLMGVSFFLNEVNLFLFTSYLKVKHQSVFALVPSCNRNDIVTPPFNTPLRISPRT
jgi:hypothetical protein